MKISSRKRKTIKKVLMNAEVKIPSRTYYMLRNLPVFSRNGTRCDLTYIPSFKLGKEFNKTFGHIHKGGEKEVYKVLWGKVLFLLQQFKSMNPSTKHKAIKKMELIHAKSGDEITIPSGWYHETINIGKSPVLLLNWLPKKTENDYNLIEKMCGFGYYVTVNGNGKEFKLIKNTNYKEVPKAKHRRANKNQLGHKS